MTRIPSDLTLALSKLYFRKFCKIRDTLKRDCLFDKFSYLLKYVTLGNAAVYLINFLICFPSVMTLVWFRHLFCLALYTEAVNLQTFVMI